MVIRFLVWAYEIWNIPNMETWSDAGLEVQKFVILVLNFIFSSNEVWTAMELSRMLKWVYGSGVKKKALDCLYKSMS